MHQRERRATLGYGDNSAPRTGINLTNSIFRRR
jgi:hypothetical protein